MLATILSELKAAGLIDRTRRVKFGDVELELAAPIDTEPKTMDLRLPDAAVPQQHGLSVSENEARLLEEIERREGLYGAAQGNIPSDYVATGQ